jgi:hypothetical protein
MIEDEQSKGGRDRTWNLLMKHVLGKVEILIGVSRCARSKARLSIFSSTSAGDERKPNFESRKVSDF